MHFTNFINGELTAPQQDSFLLKESPFDGTPLGSVTRSSPLDFIQALQGSKKALPEMKALSLETRSQILHKMASHLERNQDLISYQEALHQGLPQEFVLKNSVLPSIEILKKTANALLLEKSEDGKYQPTGLISIVTSWQFSLLLICERLAPALAAGNGVLIKVPELSPITGHILAEMVKESGLPPGSVQILQGDAEISKLMVSHPGVQAVTLVGATSTLESVAQAGLRPLKKLQLAGGAKNVGVVLGGFNQELQFDELMKSLLLGQGQLCWNTSRLLILENSAAAFYQKLENYLAELKPLLDPKGNSVWTPLISKSFLDKVDQHRALALAEKGNKISAMVQAPEQGFYSAPSFIRDLTNCSVLHQDELQAPVFLINAVKYQHEMAKWINNGYLGHSSFVWGDSEKALKVASALEVAHVGLNCWNPGKVGSVFGSKQSSFGNPDLAWNGSFYSNVKKLTVIGP